MPLRSWVPNPKLFNFFKKNNNETYIQVEAQISNTYLSLDNLDRVLFGPSRIAGLLRHQLLH